MRLASRTTDSEPLPAADLPQPPARRAPVAPVTDGTSTAPPSHHGETGPTNDDDVASETNESLRKIHHDAFELLRFSQTFAGGTTSFSSQGGDSTVAAAVAASGSSGLSPSHTALLAMAKSSDGIASELKHIAALAARTEGAGAVFTLPGASKSSPDAQHGKRPHRQRGSDSGEMRAPSSRRRKSTAISHAACHECHRAETPQWRPGPNGPDTLCNVCGLIYAKRRRRHKDNAASCALSWPS